MIAGVIAGGRPFSSTPVAATDPYWSSVVSLLHLDGADASATFTDQKGLPWTASGTAKLTTAAKKYGTASLILDGSSYIWSEISSTLVIGTANFTWESWLYVDPTAVDLGIFFVATTGGLTIETVSDAIRVGARSSTPNIVTSSSTITKGVWFHLAVVRSSGTITIYINGVSSGSAAYSSSFAGTAAQLGAITSASKYFKGKIDDFRLTIGVARYTAGFIPATEAFPNS